MNIALCDDCEIFTDIVKEYIDDYISEHNITDIHVQVFDCGEALLEKLSDNVELFDLIFLDQYMKNITGSETALKIRGKGGNCGIVFVTSDYSKYQFALSKPLTVLGKPARKAEVFKIIDSILGNKKE